MSATEQVKLQAITIGNSDFKDVIDSGTLFVDKTAHLAKLAQFKKVFLTRPRRFGKTLMLSTLQELFSHGAKDNHYFDGLAVQSLWSDSNCYPVINL
ncbi:MAG: AAA family ATPase, partial [Anaerobiospirillum sp.]|nr:AAA family ATPase [Anaerobiospirillum sp.]